MKRPITVALCFVLLLVSIILVSHSATPAHAQGKPCTIPKALGALKGSIMGALIFEAPNGTIYLVEPENPCGKVGITIQRQ